MNLTQFLCNYVLYFHLFIWSKVTRKKNDGQSGTQKKKEKRSSFSVNALLKPGLHELLSACRSFPHVTMSKWYKSSWEDDEEAGVKLFRAACQQGQRCRKISLLWDWPITKSCVFCCYFFLCCETEYRLYDVDSLHHLLMQIGITICGLLSMHWDYAFCIARQH